MLYDAYFLRNWEFSKKMAKWDLWQKKQQNRFFQKSPNFSKSKRHRAQGPTFLDYSHHFTSKTLITKWKKKCFQFFHTKMTFLPFLSQRPWQIHIYLNLARPKRVLHKLGRFFLFSRHHKIIKMLVGAQFLGAGAKNPRSNHGCCDKSGKNVIFV